MSSHSSVALLRRVRDTRSQREIASALQVDVRTVRRWESGETRPPDYLADAIYQRMLPFIELDEGRRDFRYIDLFAGVGGTRIPFDEIGGECVLTCEWNKFSRQTYEENFRFTQRHVFASDITNVEASSIPEHDLLIAGFPCQPFSLAGVSKKNALGRPHGFECATQGTLFFDIARILAEKRPRIFLLENVKHLISHDRGNTYRVIIETLKDELGYQIYPKVIDSRGFVPQHRERLILVGFAKNEGFDWDDFRFPDRYEKNLSDILHPENGSEPAEEPYTYGELARVNKKYTLTPKLWAYLQAYAEKHRLAGNGFGFGLVTAADVARTLSARYYKDGSEILIAQPGTKPPRRLTPRECARLMGFPSNFKIPVSDTQAYRQFGNSVVVPVIREVATLLKPFLSRSSTVRGTQW